MPEFGRVRCRLYLEFRHGLKRYRIGLSTARESARLASIHEHRVLHRQAAANAGVRGASDRSRSVAALSRRRDHAGRKRSQLQRVASEQRQFHDASRLHGSAQPGGLRFQLHRGRLNLHSFGDRSHLHYGVDGRGKRSAERNARNLAGAEPVFLEGDVVGSRSQRRENVDAGRIRHAQSDDVGARVPEGHASPWNNCLRSVGYGSRNRGAFALRERRCCK